jgi:hypothetical protein
MKVLVTGATGFIGRSLIPHLLQSHSVTVLTRDPSRARLNVPTLEANLEAPGPWCDALSTHDAVIHLAGEPLAGKRWDARQKQIIRDSRVETTRTLVEAIARASPRPTVLITASGVDYYPFASGPADFDDDAVTEADPPGDSFLSRVCRDWEHEALAATGLRVVCMRTGLVLGNPALSKLSTPFKLYLGGRIGNGRQWVSWIHISDVVQAYATALTDSRYTGPINLVADSIRNSEFSAALGKSLHRPSWLPVPAFALRLATGELSDYLLNGRRVVPSTLLSLSFPFHHRTIATALG